MIGYQLSFFTNQDHKHHGKPIAEWIVEQACKLGIRGATLLNASEGYGHHRRIHSTHFFDLSDQPQEVILAVTEDEANKLFAEINEQAIKVFYTKTKIEFGMLGDDN
jgi:PII-like signaling protein